MAWPTLSRFAKWWRITNALGYFIGPVINYMTDDYLDALDPKLSLVVSNLSPLVFAFMKSCVEASCFTIEDARSEKIIYAEAVVNAIESIVMQALSSTSFVEKPKSLIGRLNRSPSPYILAEVLGYLVKKGLVINEKTVDKAISDESCLLDVESGVGQAHQGGYGTCSVKSALSES